MRVIKVNRRKRKSKWLMDGGMRKGRSARSLGIRRIFPLVNHLSVWKKLPVSRVPSSLKCFLDSFPPLLHLYGHNEQRCIQFILKKLAEVDIGIFGERYLLQILPKIIAKIRSIFIYLHHPSCICRCWAATFSLDSFELYPIFKTSKMLMESRTSFDSLTLDAQSLFSTMSSTESLQTFRAASNRRPFISCLESLDTALSPWHLCKCARKKSRTGRHKRWSFYLVAFTLLAIWDLVFKNRTHRIVIL